MRTARRKSKFAVQEDADPLSVVVNLFDVAMVFAVALMVAMVMHMNMTEVFTQEDFTIVKNPGKDNMEIIMKEGNKINKYTPSNEQSSGSKGERVGIAYELENGEIIYRNDNNTLVLSDWRLGRCSGEKSLYFIRCRRAGNRLCPYDECFG